MTASAFIFALQLGDSALPTGRFSHSYGLEEILFREPDLEEHLIVEIVESMLMDIVAPLDGVAVLAAHRLTAEGDLDGLTALDCAVTARKITPSSRQASTACGRRLSVLMAELTDEKIALGYAARVGVRSSDGNLAVVEGALASALGIPATAAVLLELRGTAATLLSAAVRLGRLSAMRAQVAGASLVPTLCQALDVALATGVADMRAVGPELDLAAIQHARRDVRLFAT